MQPVISVIVPVYNVEPYIRKSLDSVIAQTFGDFEIILVDDGSTDNSGKICDEYAVADSRVKVVHQVNRGVSAARNRGIEVSVGQWIAFVDADDIVEPDYLMRLYSDAIVNKSDISICVIEFIDEDGRIECAIREKDGMIDTIEILNGFFSDKFIKSNMTGPCNKLISKGIIGKTRYKPYALCEDFLFLFELYSKSPTTSYINYNGYKYLRRKNSATTSAFSAKKLDYVRAAHDILILSQSVSKPVEEKARVWVLYHSIVSLRNIFSHNMQGLFREFVEAERAFISENSNLIKRLGWKRKIDGMCVMHFPWVYRLLHLMKRISEM